MQETGIIPAAGAHHGVILRVFDSLRRRLAQVIVGNDGFHPATTISNSHRCRTSSTAPSSFPPGHRRHPDAEPGLRDEPALLPPRR